MPHQISKPGYMSVTEVLNVINKPYLYYWYGKNGTEECERIKKESQEIGIKLHAEIEKLFKQEKVQTKNKKLHNMLDNFYKQFVLPYGVKPIRLEETLEDPELKLQGTYDAVIQTIHGTFIADWKTSNSIDKVTVPLQLSAYAYLCEKTGRSPATIDNGIVVRIDKKSNTVEIKEYYELDKYWPVFLSCLKVAQYVKGI